jgi:uncharacterized protein
MRCKHCYHAVEGFDNKILPLENVKEYVDLAAKEYKKIHILLHGGEPTMVGKEYLQGLFDYEHELEQQNIRFTNTLQTNGLLLDDEWCDLLQANRVNLGISFDGPNNFILREQTEQVFHNIKLLRKRDYNFAILCVETMQTIFELKSTYEWFKFNGLDYKILPIFSCGNANEVPGLTLDARTYADEMTKLYNYWLQDRECNIRVNTLEEFTLLFCPNYNIHFGQGCICHRLCINPDGNLYPCGRPYSEEFCLGHISNCSSISELFESESYKKLINISIARNSNCKEVCPYYLICGGGCISNSILDGSNECIHGEACLRSLYLFQNIEAINQKLYYDIEHGKEDSYNQRAVKRIKKYLNSIQKKEYM